MNSQLIPVYLILGFIGFRFLIVVFYPFFVLIHELGHAIPAHLAGKQEIRLVVGKSSHPVEFRLMGIDFCLSFKNSKAGYTSYKGRTDSLFELYFIFGTAPLISLLLTVGGVILWRAIPFSFAAYYILAAAWLANFHITFNSLWPFRGNPDTVEESEKPGTHSKSDLRNLIEALRQKD